MNIPTEQIIEELSRPSAYPYPVDEVEIIQTHISVVFLAGDRVYKVKKPVDFGFLDFTTLEKRKHFCEEELRLNRRLSPGMYLKVVAVTQGPVGLRFGEIDLTAEIESEPEAALDSRLSWNACTRRCCFPNCWHEVKPMRVSL